MSLRRLSLGIGSIAVDKLVITAVQLLLVPLLANAWGLTLYGIWAMMITIPAFLVLGDFGIVTSAWARMTMFVSRGEMGNARSVLHTAWVVTTGICLGLIALGGLLLLLLPEGIVPVTTGFDEEQSRTVILMLIVYGLGTIVFRLNTSIFRASGNLPLSIWCNTLSYALENFALVLAVFLGAKPVGAAATLLAMRCISILIVLLISFRKFPQLSPGYAAARQSEWRELWRPALSASVLGIGFLAFLQGSVLALGFAAGAAAVPAFVAVRTVSRLGWQVSLMVAQPAAQEFGHEMARGHMRKAGRYFGLVVAISTVMALGMSIGLALLGQPAVRIWTNGAIAPPYALILAMALSSFAGILWNPLSNLVLAVNRQDAIAHASIGSGAAALVFIVLSGDELGTVAAGVASAFTDMMTLAAVALFVRRNWWRDPEFRAGSAQSIAELRSPLSTLRALRGGRG